MGLVGGQSPGDGRQMEESKSAGPSFGPIGADEWGDEEYQAFGALLGVPGDKLPRAGSGHKYDPMNFAIIGTMVRNPPLAEKFLGFNAYLLQRTALTPRLRELVILRIAHRRRSSYEWAEHVDSALELGMTADEVEAVAIRPESFDGDDRLVLDAADELLDRHRLASETWQRLVDELGERAAMDVVFIVGCYSLLAMAFETWGLVADADGAPLLDPGATS